MSNGGAPVMQYQLDAKRLLCPMPVIRTQDKIAGLQPGDTLEVVCTDPGALNDVPAWCRINGHRVLSTRREEDEIVITIEVGHGT
jgi:tRNA 2-thiouridine synthesizing protein A